MTKKIIFIITCLAIIFLIVWVNRPKTVKIGYFHGGRTMLLYRAYINKELDLGNVGVELYTKDLDNPNMYRIPDRSSSDINTGFGKIRGGELIDEVVSGYLDGATVGESSFIKAVTEGKPIIAVALLGHDTKEKPAHAILIKKGLTITSPGQLKGKILATRRAGDGDATFLKEFLVQNGLNPDTDVTIKEQVDDTTWISGLEDGTFDGGYYHEMAVESLVASDIASIYRLLNWVNPEISQALLIFSKNFVKQHPDEIKKIVQAYMKRIDYEQSLPRDVRLQYSEGLQMEEDFQGMNLPQYSSPPLVSIKLLVEMQALLIKHQVLPTKIPLEPFINNSFIQ